MFSSVDDEEDMKRNNFQTTLLEGRRHDGLEDTAITSLSEVFDGEDETLDDNGNNTGDDNVEMIGDIVAEVDVEWKWTSIRKTE